MSRGKGAGIGRRKAIEIRRRKAKGTGPRKTVGFGPRRSIGAGPGQAVGIVWYRREDYARLKEMFPDGDRLPDTFEEWTKKSQEVCAVLTAQGLLFKRVYLGPETFPEWCKARGLKMDAEARTKYALESHGEPPAPGTSTSN